MAVHIIDGEERTFFLLTYCLTFILKYFLLQIYKIGSKMYEDMFKSGQHIFSLKNAVEFLFQKNRSLLSFATVQIFRVGLSISVCEPLPAQG